MEGRPEGGYTDVLELICCDCGDHPDLDYRDVTLEYRAATGAVTTATEADGPVTTWRVEANTAYSTEAPRIVYRPYCAGPPITDAYPSA